MFVMDFDGHNLQSSEVFFRNLGFLAAVGGFRCLYLRRFDAFTKI